LGWALLFFRLAFEYCCNIVSASSTVLFVIGCHFEFAPLEAYFGTTTSCHKIMVYNITVHMEAKEDCVDQLKQLLTEVSSARLYIIIKLKFSRSQGQRYLPE